jgi:twinkle protein
MISERHAKILEARGFDIELLDRFGIESNSRLGSDCIAIPVIQGGVRINTKYRTIAGEKRFLQEVVGARQIFWNVDRINDETLFGQPLIITEGEFDAIAAIQSGFGRVVSVPNGAPKSELGADRQAERYRFIEEAPKALGGCKEIILATDGDGPGIALLNDMALRLGRVRCRWVQYPRGCKDLAEVLRVFGQRGVVETINAAKWMEIDGLYRMSELAPLPEMPPHDSGFPGLAQHYRLRPGDLTVVTGIPSHGKTTVVNDIACRMVLRHKWRVCFASFEQIAQRDHKRWLRTWYGRRYVVEQSLEELALADHWIDQNFLFIVPGEDDDVTLEWLVERLSSAVVRHGVGLLIIDPWNEIEHDRPPHLTQTEYTGLALRALKRFARKHQVHLIIVAHPAKLQRDRQSGEYPFPSLYDIADSAHWYNRPDVGIVVWRGKDAERTVVRIAKARYHDEIGVPGDVIVRYVKERSTFEAAQ